jgi:Serpin (serine protease inhibitor)
MNGNGEEPQFTDAVGKTVSRPHVPPHVASPINLLNPDRYEFYTFNDNGELIKRLMTLNEIQSIVANGNGATIADNESESQSVLLNTIPLSSVGTETRVQDIVDNVQNVLSREIENNKNASSIPTQLLDTPDVSSSWSMILPAIFGNTGDEILPHKPINMTPETEIDEMTTTKIVPTRRPTTTKTATTSAKTTTWAKTTKTPTTTKRTTTLPPLTKEQTTSAFTKTKTQTTSTVTSTKKQTTKARPKPTVMATRSTTLSPPTFASEPFTESAKATISPSTTVKQTTTKKITKRPTSLPLYKRPLTNSPIIIEKIPKRPLVVESKTEGIEIETKTEKVTQSPATTVEMKVNPMSRAPVTTTRKTTTEVPSTTTKRPTTTTTTMVETTTFSNSEEDRQDSAINQIIGSLQSDLFKPYEPITTTTEEEIESTTMIDLAMREKLGDFNLIPDKVLLPDELFVDEEEPIVKNLPTTTALAEDDIMTTDAPMFEKLEATTVKSLATAVSLENSEVMQTIEKLIKEQVNAKTKTKPEKLDVLGFDDDDETELKLKETLDSKSSLSQGDFITKAATVASILSTKFIAEPTTTTVAPSEESDTTVPTILSEALSNVIELMIREQEAKRTTTTKPNEPIEPSEFDLNKILHHYEDLNTKQDQLEALSMLSEKFATTTGRSKVEDQTTLQAIQEVETSVVKETSSVSMKVEPKMPEDSAETTTESEEFSTFFFVEVDHDETTLDPLGDFTTEQFVMTEKRISDRKGQSFITIAPATTEEVATESEEDSSDLVSEVLNAIGIASDEEDLNSAERLKNQGESQESDEVEHALSSISSSLDKTFVSDVESDISLTSKIASSIFSVADTISDTISLDDESDETTTEDIPTKIAWKHQETTEKLTQPTEKIAVTEKIEDQTELPADEPQIASETTEIAEKNETAESNEAIETIDLETASSGDKKPLVQLNIIRKDNSLEEIEFITPPTPTITKIPITEGNFIKIENIVTSTNIPKHSGFKNKGQEVREKVNSLTRSTTTTAKSSSLPEAEPSLAPIKIDEPATERVPLIEVSKPSEVYHSSTEDNLVEIKVQTKPTPLSVEEHQSTVSSSQSIKQSIKNSQQPQVRPQSPSIDLSSTPGESLGLAATTAHLNKDLSDFAKLCNELAFSFWKSITADGISQSRSVIISPFALTSTLSMIFLGARGQTSGEMNDLLRLDDMVTFNPHVVFRNISESIEQSRKSGIAAAAFVRELYSDRAQGKLLPYFKEKAQQFYGAHVEEVNFNVINDILRRRTNLLVKRHTFSKINEYLKTNNIWVNEPLAAVSANVFLVSFD